MEIENNPETFSCYDMEISAREGAEIEALRMSSDKPVADPDQWLDEEVKRNILLTTIDWAVDRPKVVALECNLFPGVLCI